MAQQNYDRICLPGTFMNSYIDSSNIRILIDGYSLILLTKKHVAFVFIIKSTSL